MAIVKVGTYRNPPVDITDYEAIVAHLEAYTRQIGNQGMILTEWTNHTTAPKIAMGSYISHGGVLYVVDTEDYALPALSSDGTYYPRVAASGDTLAITYTTNIADYSWNAVYGGLYHADESQVLPYEVVKTGVSIDKYKIINLWQGASSVTINHEGTISAGAISGASVGISGNGTVGGTLGVTGAISGATINTGDGDFEIGQNLRSTDSPTFAGYYANNAFGNHRIFPTIVLNYTFSGSHYTTQMPTMEVGMSACVAYSPYRKHGNNRLILPAGGVYTVIANPSSASGTGKGGILGGGSVIWQNTATSGSTLTYYFYVVRVG